MKNRYYFSTRTPEYFLEKLKSLGLKGEIIGYQPGSFIVTEIEVYCTEEEMKQI